MLVVAAALCGVAWVVGGCRGSSAATTFCQEAVALDCDFAFRCYSDDERSRDEFTTLFGTTASECNAKLLERQTCSGLFAGSGCPGGGKFHAAIAEACIADAKAATCDQWKARTFPMTNCGAYCS